MIAVVNIVLMLALQCLSSVLYNSHPGFYYAALVIAVIWHGRIWEGYKTDTPEGRRPHCPGPGDLRTGRPRGTKAVAWAGLYASPPNDYSPDGPLPSLTRSTVIILSIFFVIEIRAFSEIPFPRLDYMQGVVKRRVGKG